MSKRFQLTQARLAIVGLAILPSLALLLAGYLANAVFLGPRRHHSESRCGTLMRAAPMRPAPMSPHR